MSAHFTPQGPYTLGGPFTNGNANNIETGIGAVDNAKADLAGATFTGAISGTSATFSAGITGNVTGNATGLTSDNALTATAHVSGTAPSQFYLLVLPASGANAMAFGVRTYDGAATHDAVVVNNDGTLAGSVNVSYFSGTGSGTFAHGLGQTPSWIGVTMNVANSTTTVGFDSLGSTTVHININGSFAWKAIAIK